MNTPCPLTGKICEHSKNFPISEIVDGKREDLFLCNSCAQAFLMSDKTKNDIRQEVAEMEEHLPKTPGQMLKDLIGRFIPGSIKEPQKIAEEGCPKCGTTLSSIAKDKKLGCTNCYEFFGKQVLVLLKKYGTKEFQHVGKVPGLWAKQQAALEREEQRKKFNIDEHITMLEQAMNDCVSIEDYKAAATHRDTLRAAYKYRIEHDKATAELEECIRDQNFERADELKTIINNILDNCFKLL